MRKQLREIFPIVGRSKLRYVNDAHSILGPGDRALVGATPAMKVEG